LKVGNGFHFMIRKEENFKGDYMPLLSNILLTESVVTL